ncbi:MAG: L,D-transpeptidase [Gammaproteobacteria bacterium]
MSYIESTPGAWRARWLEHCPRAGRASRLALVALSLLIFSTIACSAPSPYDIEIEIDKTTRLLVVRAGEQVLKTFRVSLGRGGDGDKSRQGDKKTPIGTYRVVSFNESSKFDTFVRLNYPNVKDAYYGLRNAVISRAEFDRIVAALRLGNVPPQNTALGGAIGIHGIGEETPDKLIIHDNLDWTEGCIALRNAEIHELRPFLGLGTRVVIRE